MIQFPHVAGCSEHYPESFIRAHLTPEYFRKYEQVSVCIDGLDLIKLNFSPCSDAFLFRFYLFLNTLRCVALLVRQSPLVFLRVSSNTAYSLRSNLHLK